MDMTMSLGAIQEEPDSESDIQGYLYCQTMTRVIVRVAITGVEKRYKPTRHYVYIIQVKWSDKTEYVIYRAYSEFYELHLALLDQFPKEAGSVNQRERTIPFLPGRCVFSRNEIQKVASKRQVSLQDYCVDLVAMPAYISACKQVMEFFELCPTDKSPPEEARVRPRKSSLLRALLPFLGTAEEKDVIKDGDDLSISGPMVLEQYTVIAEYNGSSKREVSLKLGQVVDVLEKHDNGWWFIQNEDSQGWAPASYLDPIARIYEPDEPEPDYSGEKYITTNEYEAEYEDEVGFPSGACVIVMHKLLDGWWIISYNEDVGYAPCVYMEPYANKHMRKLTVTPKHSFKPATRRRTINKSRNAKNKPARDLSTYRRASKKLNQTRAQKVEYMNTLNDAHDYENTSSWVIPSHPEKTYQNEGVDSGSSQIYYQDSGQGTPHGSMEKSERCNSWHDDNDDYEEPNDYDEPNDYYEFDDDRDDYDDALEGTFRGSWLPEGEHQQGRRRTEPALSPAPRSAAPRFTPRRPRDDSGVSSQASSVASSCATQPDSPTENNRRRLPVPKPRSNSDTPAPKLGTDPSTGAHASGDRKGIKTKLEKLHLGVPGERSPRSGPSPTSPRPAAPGSPWLKSGGDNPRKVSPKVSPRVSPKPSPTQSPHSPMPLVKPRAETEPGPVNQVDFRGVLRRPDAPTDADTGSKTKLGRRKSNSLSDIHSKIAMFQS